MKSQATCFCLMILGALAASVSNGASLPASLRDESLFQSESLHRLSVGLTYEDLQRDVKVVRNQGGSVSRFVTELETKAGSFLLGVDVTPWMTLFGTLGASELDDDAFDSKTKWSAGLGLNLWRYDVTEPSFMEGRLMIKGAAEYASYASDSDEFDAEWYKLDAALTVGYEIFDEPGNAGSVSLNLYAGPLFSQMDGEIDGWDEKADFESDNDLGAVFGAEVRITRHLLLGVQGEYVDGTSLMATARFHF